MEKVLNAKNFTELNDQELMVTEGGGVVAAVYALGFVLGCAPATAVAVVAVGGAALAAGSVALGAAVTKYLS